MDEIQYRYDTQLLIDGQDLDEDVIDEYIREHFEGDSLLVVADDDVAKLHFHTNEPWKILEYCLDSAKSRNEIQEYLELSDRKSFVTAILNPLLDSELLLPTQPSVFAPNQKYITNKDKLRFEE